MTGTNSEPAQSRARARDLGVAPGLVPPGPLNAITDVPGVRVGHTTLVEGSDIRTGVTAIVPDGLARAPALAAGLAVGNGYGKIVGTTQVDELGGIETPVLLTGTLSTFRVADALVSYMLALPGNEALSTVNPVVAETNDGYLSDMRRRPVTEAHVLGALREASAGPVAEGCAGAGTGTSALGFKAGIGTSSRIVTLRAGGIVPGGTTPQDPPGGPPVTIGALVQANFSGTLTILGSPLVAGPHQDRARPAGPQRGNSCVVVLATDAPLDARRLRRVAWRSLAALARTGSDFSGSSGDYALAFSTAPPAAAPISDSELDPLFVAAIDATEEAILNSLFMARTTTGFQGHTRHAVPLDQVRRLRGLV